MSTAGGSLRPLLAVFLFWKTIFVHDCQLFIDLASVPDWHAPFFRCFEGCQIQGFQERLSAREDAALAIQLTVGGIQALYGIRSIDYSSDISRKLEDWSDNIPVAFPASHGIRVLFRPFLADTVTVYPALFLIRGIVDGFQILGKGLAVFICHILQGVTHLVYDAALILGLRESCQYCFTDPGQTVSADDQDIFDAAVLETVQDRKPVLGAFIITNFDRQDLLLSFTVDSQDDISCQLFDLFCMSGKG